MSTVVLDEIHFHKTTKLLVKGAPETIQPLLLHVPQGYTQTYQHYAEKGYRVIALADKLLDDTKTVYEYCNTDREDLENNLTFRGFLLSESPLKKDTKLWMNKFMVILFLMYGFCRIRTSK